ncbi:5-oxoprolinase subunit PxpB [Colwellia sp. MB02u-18]|uniref:5-oxoprolinase subunit PxpB n=1 Tax=unclassified Colwellia TaxID=196834 RepID=UPI0015F55345|nr:MULTISPECIES: 5-oxoprolinase subunit PxpB [unclassified Colwellia]MBA6223595.1 5-oxoprolinase subunit PxpB [Colwellia sp. MB3u-45]MBA6267339.1 5-oxoprolinase subunit PxpB [Colwellia sp. MB3u-43]MBA6319776.1 5-oxoprolinase subunit PxpB [Colwellia sp. MB02u-19]MBA6323845.1 5-oxoprolinase subunit PxpB [Colwellia sp. MB02u-18]MBA6330835.1 5-oxoprolinase subunit PxpB [Colwellia sp. MB02u-12]
MVSNNRERINAKVSNSTEHGVNFTIDLVAENALLLSWQAKISLTQHNEIIALQAMITQQLGELIIETVASYHCLMVYYCPQLSSSLQVIDKINRVAKNASHKNSNGDEQDNNPNNKLAHQAAHEHCIKIPVYYDREQEWDLADVAKRCNMSMDEVIKQHSAHTYHGYALGFTPGFCYLASLPESLQLPRKSSPRIKVPKGAVAIAEQQSAIYPIESPGGWHIIGQTPLPMYESHHGQFNASIQVGQNVQFYAISKAEFLALEQGLAE